MSALEEFGQCEGTLRSGERCPYSTGLPGRRFCGVHQKGDARAEFVGGPLDGLRHMLAEGQTSVLGHDAVSDDLRYEYTLQDGQLVFTSMDVVFDVAEIERHLHASACGQGYGL